MSKKEIEIRLFIRYPHEAKAIMSIIDQVALANKFVSIKGLLMKPAGEPLDYATGNSLNYESAVIGSRLSELGEVLLAPTGTDTINIIGTILSAEEEREFHQCRGLGYEPKIAKILTEWLGQYPGNTIILVKHAESFYLIANDNDYNGFFIPRYMGNGSIVEVIPHHVDAGSGPGRDMLSHLIHNYIYASV